MTDAILAGGIGLAAGSALVLGALIAWFVRVPDAVVAGVMAFGSGVLISALAYELVQEANAGGGLIATVAGFLVGAVVYVSADSVVARFGGIHRKRSSDLQASEQDRSGSGIAIAIGALLDGIPESVVLGLGVASGGRLSLPIIAAIAISNLPEGLSSSAGMKRSGRSAAYVFGVWGGIAVVSGVASLLGFLLLAGASASVIAFMTTIAAGAILAMIANTMIPEAFAQDRSVTGLITAVGFVSAFALHEIG